MPITRNFHLRYMTKLTPLLVLLYIAQIWLYKHFAPPHLTNDLSLILGVGLALIILSYHSYDQHHKIICHNNFIEISFDLFGIKEEILYTEISSVKIKQNNHEFGNLTITDRDERVYRLYHIDNPAGFAAMIAAKKLKLS